MGSRLLDSGASSHMTYDQADFEEYRELSGALDITVANGHRLTARGVGAVRLCIDGGRTVKVTAVLYVPGLDRQLLSIPALVANLRVFGSRSFMHVDKSKRSKWDRKAHRCIFLGYADASKAYRVWDLDDERLVVTRTVALDEHPPSEYSDVSHGQDQLVWAIAHDEDDRVVQPAASQPSGVLDMEVDTGADGSVDEPMEVDSDGPAPSLLLILELWLQRHTWLWVSGSCKLIRDSGDDARLPNSQPEMIENRSHLPSLLPSPSSQPVEESRIVFHEALTRPSSQVIAPRRFLRDAPAPQQQLIQLPSLDMAPSSQSNVGPRPSDAPDSSYLTPGFRELLEDQPLLMIEPP